MQAAAGVHPAPHVHTCGVCTSHSMARRSVFITRPCASTSFIVGFTGTPSTAAPTCSHASERGIALHGA